MKRLAICTIAILLAAITTAPAQRAPFNSAGITMGHWHLNSRDVEANKKIFVALGGVAAKPGDFDIVKFPDVVVFLHLRAGSAPSTGGSQGSVIDHAGFYVTKCASRGCQVESCGRAGPAGQQRPHGSGLHLYGGCFEDRNFGRQNSDSSDQAPSRAFLCPGFRSRKNPGLVHQAFRGEAEHTVWHRSAVPRTPTSRAQS